MIVFKDAEKHEPEKEGEYLCIVKDESGLFYAGFSWDESGWHCFFEHKVLAFSETPPETALKGISEDPEEKKQDKCYNCGSPYVSYNNLCRDCGVAFALLD